MKLQSLKSDSEKSAGPLGHTIVVHLALWLLLSFFFLTFFNRFAALRSGNGEFSGGMALLSGHFPYRDYFTAGPPLNCFKSAAALDVFGRELIISRTVGVIERLLVASILLCWLRQIVQQNLAYVAVLVTIVLSAGDRTDPVASYNHDALLFAIASGWLASIALCRDTSTRRLWALGAAAGAAAGLSLLTKQTVGGAEIAVLVTFPTLLQLRGSISRAAAWVASFSLGCVVPVAIMVAVLARMHVLSSALNMLFVAGPSAKAAHPGEFALRWGMVAVDNVAWLVLAAFWCCLAWSGIKRACLHQLRASPRGGAGWACTSLLIGVCTLGSAEILHRFPTLHDLTKSTIPATIFFLWAVLCWLGPAWFRSNITLRGQRILLFAAVSLASAVALSLSWPLFEAMLLPGLGLLLALLLEGVAEDWRGWVYGVLVFLVFMQAREKLNLPFAFDHQLEAPVYEATRVSNLPELRGMRLPETMVNLLDQTTSLVRTHTCSTDSIFTFPEMSLFYTLTDRWPPTWAPSHNIDVVNDALAVQDARLLEEGRPAVIVTYREGPGAWTAAERLWRRGRPSGQRQIAAVVEELTRTYRLVGSYELRQGDPPIMVYLRPDATVERAQACREVEGRVGK